MIIFKRDSANNIVIEYPNAVGWGKFPWSPSWSEINYHAFDMPTVELHNELFGFIQEQNSINKIMGTGSMDAHLSSRGLQQSKSWVKQSGGVAQPSQSVTLPTYVRNSIHHPENPHNPRYSDTELKESIEFMLLLA